MKCIAEQLGLDGSYVSHTYIEQIQMEKLVNDVMVMSYFCARFMHSSLKCERHLK